MAAGETGKGCGEGWLPQLLTEQVAFACISNSSSGATGHVDYPD